MLLACQEGDPDKRVYVSPELTNGCDNSFRRKIQTSTPPYREGAAAPLSGLIFLQTSQLINHQIAVVRFGIDADGTESVSQGE